MSDAKKKYKSFTYENQLEWSGNRVGQLVADGKPDLKVSSPPEFKGEDGVWSPEDMFVSAVNACTMTTFLAFASHKKLALESYESHGEGLLARVESGYEFTVITLKPRIRIGDQGQLELAEQILHDAHAKCLITNSIKAEVEIEPDIRVAE